MRFLPIVYFCALILLSPKVVYAADVSLSIDVFNETVTTGDIISFVNGKYLLSFSENDPAIFGVINNNPTLSLLDTSLTAVNYVTTSGEAYVKVSGIGGPIEVGDFVTSSKIPGVGVKATTSGRVVGVALEEYNPADPNQISEVLVSVEPSTAFLNPPESQNILGVLRSGLQVPFITPLTSLRYILAALIALVSFFVGFNSFGKTSTNSIEALGRNPLASRLIKAAVVLNFIFTIGIMAIGLSISYLILTL